MLMDLRILPLVRKSTRTHWWASSNLCSSRKEEPWDNNWTTKLSRRINSTYIYVYTHDILHYRKKLLLALAKPLGSSDSTPWFSFTVPGSSSLLSVVTLSLLWTAVREWKVVVTGVGVVCWGIGLIWSLVEVSTEFNGRWIITGFGTTLARFGGMRPCGICIICPSHDSTPWFTFSPL